LLSNVNSLIKNDNLKLNDSSTIAEYMTARVYILINSILHKGKIKAFDPIAKKNITKRILGINGISVKDISTKVSKEQLEFVNQNLLSFTSRKEILKTAIAPIENIIKDFSLEVLKSFESAFIIDNQKENKAIKKELQNTIDEIHSADSSESMSVLKRELTKIKRFEKTDTARKGFVFDYSGSDYKFSGNFTPVNQMLGIFKSGEQKEKLDESKKKTIKEEIVAVIPGSFKPPHKGHLSIAKAYGKLADKVVIMVSPLPRQLSTGESVTPIMSKNIWDTYLQAEGLSDKIKVVNSRYGTPSMAVEEFIMNKENNPDFAQPGQKVLIGCSTKDNDANDMFSDSPNFVREGVLYEFKLLKELGKLNSKDMREAICKGNKNKLKGYLPDSVNKNKVAEQILSMFSKQKMEENIIYDIITEQVTKVKYSLLKKENSAAGMGAIQGAAVNLKPEGLEQK
jgi:cytidyltransferase-like protein